MQFNSNILILPGYSGSGLTHWQTLWEKEFGFKRIEQKDWMNPSCDEWVEAIEAEVNRYTPENIIIVAHSLGCIAFAYWCERFHPSIKGALLVAPCDTEAITAPPSTEGFEPIPEIEMPFPTILVTSTNDHYITFDRAVAFAECWGSELVNLGNAGHINPASGYGKWYWGLELLKKLDEE